MSNRLKNSNSPYLLQHADNPVDWFPWGEEAFEKARKEDKPVFLSVGYSSCHWCHVMAEESFEDEDTADILNESFISVKVDREERPDIDSIYMAVCQAMTGSGGWPMTVIMTPEQKPFFAGSYFPKEPRFGAASLKSILLAVKDKWQNDRESLMSSAEEIISALKTTESEAACELKEEIISKAVSSFKQSFDAEYGGFGDAPKFPTPHILMFLMDQYKIHGDKEALKMAELSLIAMYAGGLFDHIGFGFSRYSTDRYFLVPHFEKMLYDNAMLILAYSMAYEITERDLYLDVAEKTAEYLMREMRSPDGGFFSAQDADSEGEEGKFYTFKPEEITKLLGEKIGSRFNEYYGISKNGNFEGRSIPNLLHNSSFNKSYEEFLPVVREYRSQRHSIHTDDKSLCSWNSLTIAALCSLYRVSRKSEYLSAAVEAHEFIESDMSADSKLYSSFRNGKRGHEAYLDDYASYSFALISLYEASLDKHYLEAAETYADKMIEGFFDKSKGGFFIYDIESEKLIHRPKESYDGAIPSGNSIAAYVLERLNAYKDNGKYRDILKKQLSYMYGEAEHYPVGYAMFLSVLSDHFDPPELITVIVKDEKDIKDLPFIADQRSVIRIAENDSKEYKMLNGKTTYYQCIDHHCLNPDNELKTGKNSFIRM